MDDKSKQKELAPRGNEWEVVSLTASAYAAAPGPDKPELKDAWNYDACYKAETSHPLFMSDHFVFPPSEHENLPVEALFAETNNNKVINDVGPFAEMNPDKRGADMPGSWFHDDMANKNQSSIYGESTTMNEYELLSVESHDFNSETSNLLSSAKDTSNEAQNHLPCEAWWRRRAVWGYAHTKASTLWSLFVAAAVAGLVILGQRWQQERWQVMHLNWQSSIGTERLSRVLLGPLTRIKDMVLGGSRQTSFIRNGSLGEI